MTELQEFFYILISMFALLPVLIFSRKLFRENIGYAGFVLFLLIWVYNFFGFARYGLNSLGVVEEKFARYLAEYGASRLYNLESLYVTFFMFLVLLTAYGLGALSIRGKSIVEGVVSRARSFDDSFFVKNIIFSTVLLLLSLYVIRDSIGLMIVQSEDTTAYRMISQGIENYSLHSMLFRISCILVLFSFAISDSRARLWITLIIIGLMFLTMALLGQRNEIALLFLSMTIISLNRKKISGKFVVVGACMLVFIRFIEIIRSESLEYTMSLDEEIFLNLAYAVLTFWHPLLLGAETVFSHFSNLAIISTGLFQSPLERISFWILALIPNDFGVDRGLTSYALLKNTLSLSDERGYNISIFSSSAFSFGIVGAIFFIAFFGYFAGKLTAFFYKSASSSTWRGITFCVTLSVFVSYLFIINRSGIDNMKPLIFYTGFALVYGRLFSKRIRFYGRWSGC